MRLEAARQLTEIDRERRRMPAAASRSTRASTTHVRLEAARLAGGDSRWAAAAFRAIAADEGVDDDVREEAALGLAEIG